MSITAWFEKITKKLTWFDIGVLKWCVLACALLIAKLWPPILSLHWGVYAGVFALTYAYLFYVMFLK